MRNTLESGVERIKREKERNKSDSIKVERRVKILAKVQEKRRVTYTKGKRRKNGKVKEN